ncbi:TraB/GumN family protein [Clostridium sp. 'deep sea']|uniref:TraB/GumN family protein n=1 Tax=Clostridium sp. 'deep sea' TaxID=2779445 RepID=UPI001896863A|nr:TraB/GumN family protein [Clostridium sp. 'deep sea']QOR35287.1 TraB/GumN family protein [Clostridium sp. 'deep sea']
MLKNKMWKKVISSMLIVLTILITIVPSLAEAPVAQPVPDISNWARGTLNEGERLGIYPLTWYYDNFRGEISTEKLSELVTKTAEKFASLNLEVNNSFQPIVTTGNTRQDVLMLLYNCLAKYKLPSDLKLNELTAMQYLVERGIVKGSGTDLMLDRACKTEEAVILATRLIHDTYEVLNAGAKGFLWKASKNNNTVYMLGSIHLGSSAIYPMRKSVIEAFESSDQLVVEANILNQQAMLGEFIQRAMYQDGTTLKDHISEELFNKCTKLFTELGLPTETMVGFKPWSIANDLTVLASTKSKNVEEASEVANAGIDMYFLSKALLTQKPIVELEGIVFQAELFNGLSAETQEEYLTQAVENINNKGEDISEDTTEKNAVHIWLDLWKKGDIESFKQSYRGSVESDENEITNMLFGKRDEGMANKIEKMLEGEGSTTYFVVVGAGHLTVDNSVIDRLIEKGYEVKALS